MGGLKELLEVVLASFQSVEAALGERQLFFPPRVPGRQTIARDPGQPTIGAVTIPKLFSALRLFP
jgi:hypothetical protein